VATTACLGAHRLVRRDVREIAAPAGLVAVGVGASCPKKYFVVPNCLVPLESCPRPQLADRPPKCNGKLPFHGFFGLN